MKRWLAVLVVLPALATAQEGVLPSGKIRGIVLDSLHNEPLRNAVVSLGAAGQMVRTDSSGEFQLQGVPVGRYDLKAVHPLADSLGLLLEARGIEVMDGSDSHVLLAIPGKDALRELFCPGLPAGSDVGLIRGRVGRANSADFVPDVQVILSWLEIGFKQAERAGVRPNQIVTTTDLQGYYTFCALPGDLEASISAFKDSAATGSITVSLAWSESAIYLRPLLLPASGSRDATNRKITLTGTINGRVVDVAGRPVANATVEVTGSKIFAATRQDGSFRIAGAPTGTRMVRARKLGYQAALADFAVETAGNGVLQIELQEQRPQLATVVVRGMLNDVATRSGFANRAYAGTGKYASADDLAKHKPRCFLDFLKFYLPRGRGCSVLALDPNSRQSRLGFRGISTLQGLQPLPRGEAYKAPSEAAMSAGRRCLVAYVDDMLEFPNPDGEIAFNWLERSEIAGVEYYSPSTGSVRERAGTCSVLLVWTISYRGAHL